MCCALRSDARFSSSWRLMLQALKTCRYWSLNLFFRRPTVLDPWANSPQRSCLGNLLSSMRIKCPSHRRWDRYIIFSTDVDLVLRRTSVFGILSFQDTPRSFRRDLMWKFSKAFRWWFCRVYVSLPYSSAERTIALYNITLVERVFVVEDPITESSISTIGLPDLVIDYVIKTTVSRNVAPQILGSLNFFQRSIINM